MRPEHGITLTSVAMAPELSMGLHPLLQLLEMTTPILNKPHHILYIHVFLPSILSIRTFIDRSNSDITTEQEKEDGSEIKKIC